MFLTRSALLLTLLPSTVRHVMAEEKVIENVFGWGKISHSMAATTASLLLSLLESFSSANLIIDSSFLRIGKSLIGLIYFSKGIVGHWCGIFIRMNFHRFLVESLLQLRVCCSLFNSKHFVVARLINDLSAHHDFFFSKLFGWWWTRPSSWWRLTLTFRSRILWWLCLHVVQVL
jgi:hypothetical protein